MLELVRTIDEFARFTAAAAGRPLSVHVQTNARSFGSPGAKLVGVALAVPGHAVYVPFAHDGPFNATYAAREQVYALLHAAPALATHRVQSVLPWLDKGGLRWTDDTFLAATLAERDATLAELIRDFMLDPHGELLLLDPKDFDTLNPTEQDVWQHAALLAVTIAEVTPLLAVGRSPALETLYRTEVTLAVAFARSTQVGYPVDLRALPKLRERLVEAYEQELATFPEAGMNARRLGESLAKAGVRNTATTATGLVSWAAEVVDGLAVSHPLAARAKAAREIKGAIDTLAKLGPVDFVRPEWYSLKPGGGAWPVAVQPPMLSWPPLARKAIAAPDGYSWVCWTFPALRRCAIALAAEEWGLLNTTVERRLGGLQLGPAALSRAIDAWLSSGATEYLQRRLPGEDPGELERLAERLSQLFPRVAALLAKARAAQGSVVVRTFDGRVRTVAPRREDPHPWSAVTEAYTSQTAASLIKRFAAEALTVEPGATNLIIARNVVAYTLPHDRQAQHLIDMSSRVEVFPETVRPHLVPTVAYGATWHAVDPNPV